jgi:hypothetical protein
MTGLSDVVGARSRSNTSISDDLIMQRMIEIYKVLEQKQYPFIEQIQLLAILPETMRVIKRL